MVHAVRRKGRTRSRILYWFRTPPGVRVGRAALDEEAIRLIEASNPGVQFDWPRILRGEDVPERRLPESGRPERRLVESQQPARGPVPVDVPAPMHPPGSLPDTPDEPSVAASHRLGAEGLVRLRGRHAAVLAKIDDRVQDEQRRTELKELAERLNPDSWVTDEEVRAGLEEYEATYDRLRTSLGRREPAAAPAVAEPDTPPPDDGRQE